MAQNSAFSDLLKGVGALVYPAKEEGNIASSSSRKDFAELLKKDREETERKRQQETISNVAPVVAQENVLEPEESKKTAFEADKEKTKETPSAWNQIYSEIYDENGIPSLDAAPKQASNQQMPYALQPQAKLVEDPITWFKQQEAAQKTTRANKAQSKRRKNDILNRTYDEIANEFGITLSPEDYKSLRGEHISPFTDDGSYSDVGLRQSLNSRDEYLQKINERNKKNTLDSIYELAKYQAYTPTNYLDFGDSELLDLQEQLLGARDNLANATREKEIASAQKAINDLEEKIAKREDELLTESNNKTSYSDKLAELANIYSRLNGESAGSGGRGKDEESSQAGGKGGDEEEQASEVIATPSEDNQGKEFYEWLKTPSGQAFKDYWFSQGLDLSKEAQGWSHMRATNNSDLWGNVYGYGDLSKYGLEDFQAPENWNARLLNSGLDINAEDLVDQLMNYMFVTNALRRSDLTNPDWSRYGSVSDMPELISYLYKNDLMPDINKDFYGSFGLDENDIASYYLVSRLSQGDRGGLSAEALRDVINQTLDASGEKFELGFLGEDSPYYEDESRSNRQVYNPAALYGISEETPLVRPYSYSDEENGPYDLIDWDILDTYYQILNEEAQKQGKKIGLSGKKGE